MFTGLVKFETKQDQFCVWFSLTQLPTETAWVFFLSRFLKKKQLFLTSSDLSSLMILSWDSRLRLTSWKDAISCVISLLACLGESCAKFCSNPQLNFNKPNCCSVQFSSVCLLLCASPWPYVEDMLQITSPSLPVKFHHVFKMVETADEQMNLMNIYQTKSMVQSQTQKEKAAHVFTCFVCRSINIQIF